MNTQAFSGVITAIITPFTKKGTLDLDAFHKLILLQKNSGIAGIVVLGTTGEGVTLTEQESDELVSAALEHKTDDFQILVGTGTNSTAATIEKSVKYASFEAHGKTVDGLLIVTPYYNKPQQEHLVYHYHEVCSAVPQTPVCLYNVPGRTGVNVQVQTFCKIAAQNQNMVAIKEAAGNVNTIAEMRLALNKSHLSEVRILSGDDATFAPSLLCGADGIISVTSHIIPKAMCAILQSALEHNWDNVSKVHLKTYSINNGIFAVTNPVGVKCLLSKMHLCLNVLRAPLYPANDLESAALTKILDDLNRTK